MENNQIESKEMEALQADAKPDGNQSKDNEVDIAVEALHQLTQGKRHLLVEDYSSAVACFQESCQLLDNRFGIGAEECGEAYLYYGTALLELARLEDGLFDVAELSGEEETEDEEEEEEDESQEESQDETENKDNDKEKEGKKTDTEEDIENSDEEKKKKENGAESNVEAESAPQTSAATDTAGPSDPAMDCQPSTSKGEPNEDNGDDENDASNIEVAWEVLCLAKNVFDKFVDKNDNKLKLAETFQKLGEISIEWENNVNAIDLLTRCLDLRKQILLEDDRLIAETYYHLGIAYSFNNNIESATNCFHSAVEVIETRISNQKQKLSTIKADDIEATESIKREITRLESLLPEMKLKIEDQKEQHLNVKEALEREQTEQKEEEAISSKNNEIKDKPISDISHLIKRKRQNSGSESSPKKVCSNGVNVDNGDSEKKAAIN